MKCYLVTFKCLEACIYSPGSGQRDIVRSFYSDNPADLTEQILEYQEDLEEDGYIVLNKLIEEVHC